MSNEVSARAVLGFLPSESITLNTDGLSLFVPFDRKLERWLFLTYLKKEEITQYYNHLGVLRTITSVKNVRLT